PRLEPPCAENRPEENHRGTADIPRVPSPIPAQSRPAPAPPGPCSPGPESSSEYTCIRLNPSRLGRCRQLQDGMRPIFPPAALPASLFPRQVRPAGSADVVLSVFAAG